MTSSALQYLFADPPDSYGESGNAPLAAREHCENSKTIAVNLDDRVLIHRIAQRDEAALHELYARTYPQLWDFAYSLTRVRETADELVQDAFMLVWERARTWNAQAHVRGFLYLAVRNGAHNRQRRVRVAERGVSRAVPEIVSTSMAEEPLMPDVHVEQRELLHAAVSAIAALPEPRRTALVLRWREQLAYEEIARVLGTSSAMARQLVTRARATVRREVAHLLDPES